MEPIICTSCGYPVGRWSDFYEAVKAELTLEQVKKQEVDVDEYSLVGGQVDLRELFSIMKVDHYCTRRQVTSGLTTHDLRTKGL